MMVTDLRYWWRNRYVGDFMMATDLRCCWRNHYGGDFFRYVGDFLNVLIHSPTSQTCHQHIWSPTSVTTIDVTLKFSLIQTISERVAAVATVAIVAAVTGFKRCMWRE